MEYSRDRTDHMDELYNNPDLYITHCFCKVYKLISDLKQKMQIICLCRDIDLAY